MTLPDGEEIKDLTKSEAKRLLRTVQSMGGKAETVLVPAPDDKSADKPAKVRPKTTATREPELTRESAPTREPASETGKARETEDIDWGTTDWATEPVHPAGHDLFRPRARRAQHLEHITFPKIARRAEVATAPYGSTFDPEDFRYLEWDINTGENPQLAEQVHEVLARMDDRLDPAGV